MIETKTFDYSILNSKTWDRETLNYIGLIHEFKGRQQLYLQQKPEELDKLVELAKRQSTEASNEIEGIVTTNARLAQLMTDKVEPKTRNEKEILGYRNVLNLIHDNFMYIPIRPSYILQLHKEMYSFSNQSFGGKFKDSPNEIAAVYSDGTKKVLFKPLEPFETPEAMEKLCEEYNSAVSKQIIDPLIAIPIFIHDFLCIHPFNDGNGRISRLLTTLLLYKSGYFVGKYISIEKKIQTTKQEYYDALAESTRGWIENEHDETPFIKYMLGIILSTYRDFEERVDLVGEKRSAKEMVEKAVSTKIGKFTKSDIMELCPEIGRGSVENALKQMVEDGKIEIHGGGRSTFYTRKS